MIADKSFQNYAVLDSGKTKYMLCRRIIEFQNYAVLDSGKTKQKI